ncbi:MAG TPA: response regulator [Thermoanaerobaculia bacterium]|nr:response regulator [Thermoanaerobaculia bacterium]
MSSSNDRPAALVVEDEEPERQTMIDLLTKEGFEVEFARNGEDAIKALSERDYRLILLDVHLPKVDGYGIMKWLKERYPERLSKTVVVSHVAADDLKIFFPISRVFTKPVNPADIIEIARATLRGETPSE